MKVIRNYLFCLTMMLGMTIGMSVNVLAAETTYVETSWNPETKTVDKTSKTAQAIPVTSGMTSMSDGWYVVNENVTIESRITLSGTVNLILADGKTLTASAGITTTDAVFNIYAQTKGTGALEAGITDDYSSGIGGVQGGKGGKVTIYGGLVTSQGGSEGAAGIGGGESGEGGEVTIYSGTVTAKGPSFGAGIGGGRGGKGGKVIIYGGTVTASSEGNCCAAGIGGSMQSGGAAVIISGGTVRAAGESGAMGIGRGSNGSSDGTITLEGCRLYGSDVSFDQAAEIPLADGDYARYRYMHTEKIPASLSVTGVSGSFDDMIKLNFYFKEAEGYTIPENAYVTLSGGEDSRSVTTKFSEAARSSGGEYIFSIPLYANEAGDTITANVYDGNNETIPVSGSSGKIYSEDELQYSLMNYFSVLAQSGKDDTAKALGAAAKDYCSAAQIYFKYGNYVEARISDAIDAVTEETLSAYTSKRSGTKPAQLTVEGVSATIEEDNTLRVYLTSTGNFTYKVDDTVMRMKQKSDGSTYLALTEGTAAKDLDTAHVYRVLNSSGTELYSIEASVLTYARACVRSSKTDLQNLGKAMYLYNQAANAAFE